mgnify:CR=1 FL=1
MACDNVFDAFAIATESLDQEVYRNASYRSVWLNAVPRGQFKTGTGTTQTTFTIENSEPVADIETWTEITNTAVSGGSDGGARSRQCYRNRSFSGRSWRLRADCGPRTPVLAAGGKSSISVR